MNGTNMVPGREASSIIDYIAINTNCWEEVSGIHYRDWRENTHSDHALIYVRVSVSAPAPRPMKVGRHRPALAALRQISSKDRFWKTLKEHCDQQLSFLPLLGNTVDEDYQNFRSQLESVTESALRATPPTRITLRSCLKTNPAIVQLKVKRNKLFHAIKRKSREERVVLKRELRVVSRALQRETRKTLTRYKLDRANEIERLGKTDSKRMWRELKTLSGWKHKHLSLPDTVLEDGKEIRGEGVGGAWKRAFETLGEDKIDDTRYDGEFRERILLEVERINQDSLTEPHLEELDGEITEKEIKKAVRRLRAGTSPGHDDITVEVLKKGGAEVSLALFLLCKKIWERETCPADWSKGVIHPLLKEGDDREPSNYRGITLLSVVGKVFTQVLQTRLVGWVEKKRLLEQEQGGFRPGIGCTEQTFSLVELVKNRGREKDTFCCFIDIKKAFDRVFRAGLWQRLAQDQRKTMEGSPMPVQQSREQGLWGGSLV